MKTLSPQSLRMAGSAQRLAAYPAWSYQPDARTPRASSVIGYGITLTDRVQKRSAERVQL